MHNVCVIVTFTIVYNVAFLSAFTLLIFFYIKTCMMANIQLNNRTNSDDTSSVNICLH